MSKIAVSCMGSRERYSIPLALKECGLLTRLYTDVYVPNWISKCGDIGMLPSSVRALLGRNHPDLLFSMVSSQYFLGFDFRLKVRRATNLLEQQKLIEAYGRRFSSYVGECLENEDVLISFTGEALESFYACKEKGIKTVLDQVDPGLLEWERLRTECEKYPDWGVGLEEQYWSSSFEKRVKLELDNADEIIVNSEYSMKSLRYWGIDQNITILPIPSAVSRKKKEIINMSEALNVLFIGFLSLRKGVHIALKAIDILVERGFDVSLTLVGSCVINPSKLNEYKGNKYLGPMPGSEIPKLLDACDVLLFPTLSDGFGMVQVEAISRGVPVITTKNSAEIISNGKSGFIVEAGDVDAVVSCLEKYCEDRNLLASHSVAAYEESVSFTRDEYQKVFNDKMIKVLSV